MEKKLTDSQIKALDALVAAGGSLPGRDGWANGNTVNKLIRTGLVSFEGWCSCSITEKGRAARLAGSYEVTT